MDTPQIRNVEWIRIVPQVIVALLAWAAFEALQVFEYWALDVIAAWLVVIGYRYLVRYSITRHYAKGVRLFKAQRYEEAIQAFERNLAFFERHPNLDKWRSMIFLSPGKYGYREATLLSLGSACGWMGDGRRLEQYLERALELNPRNAAAIGALNVLYAGKTMHTHDSQSR